MFPSLGKEGLISNKKTWLQILHITHSHKQIFTYTDTYIQIKKYKQTARFYKICLQRVKESQGAKQ